MNKMLMPRGGATPIEYGLIIALSHATKSAAAIGILLPETP